MKIAFLKSLKELSDSKTNNARTIYNTRQIFQCEDFPFLNRIRKGILHIIPISLILPIHGDKNISCLKLNNSINGFD
jgi:hypothetical protein